ncbi:MAG: hypothetical protein HYW50_02395 [Candidatus Diapherotrites archaeon]|nr:hypothetical protein [Candidatus Diapherotrites archaeon]
MKTVTFQSIAFPDFRVRRLVCRPAKCKVFFSPRFSVKSVPVIKSLGVQKIYSLVPLSKELLDEIARNEIELVSVGLEKHPMEFVDDLVLRATKEVLAGKVILFNCLAGKDLSYEYAEAVREKILELVKKRRR